MKTSLRFIVPLMVFAASTAVHGADLKWKPFEEGFAEAKKTKKKIMIDVYTNWCGWCKRLDRDVYGNDKVADYLSQQYVIIKLNAESNSKIRFEDAAYTEAELARAFGVTGYPTIIFFNSDGEPLDKLGGYVAANQFLPIIKYFGENVYKTMTWQEYRQQPESSSKQKPSKKK